MTSTQLVNPAAPATLTKHIPECVMSSWSTKTYRRTWSG